MVTLSQLVLVAGAAVVFAVVPGPAVVFIVTRSVDQSRRAGVASGLGVACGNLALVVAAAFGLSALLTTSEIAYDVVRFAGAAYLVYLGVRRLLDRSVPSEAGEAVPQRLSRLFGQGLVVGVLNPKAALFIFSFLPQFVNQGHGAVAAQMLVLGTVVVAITLVSDCCYAALAGGVAQSLLRRPKVVRRQQIVAGCVYIGLGVAAAVSGPSHSTAKAR
ncbi:LysE family translocator [Catenulispora rubra]|uniref:LysE family translocator n=1 Tax=Catenulispora rubra TaxID=280293 RepID=UPI0018924342|nr:LysE family translocator [Catenulispora rubra]